MTLREKCSFETRPHEERRRADRVSSSLRLALQSHRRHTTRHVSDYNTSETCMVLARLPLRSNWRHILTVAHLRLQWNLRQARSDVLLEMRNQVVSSLVWLWWVIDLARFEFESGLVLFCFSFIFVSFEELCFLVTWCAGGTCGMTCSDEDRGRSRRPGAEDRGWLHRSGTRWPDGREVGWRRVWSAPSTWRLGVRVSWLSLKTKVDGLWVVWPQNHSDGF
jgi:hypothetical protein